MGAHWVPGTRTLYAGCQGLGFYLQTGLPISSPDSGQVAPAQGAFLYTPHPT